MSVGIVTSCELPVLSSWLLVSRKIRIRLWVIGWDGVFFEPPRVYLIRRSDQPGLSDKKYCGDSGVGLPLQYLLNSGWRFAFSG